MHPLEYSAEGESVLQMNDKPKLVFNAVREVGKPWQTAEDAKTSRQRYGIGDGEATARDGVLGLGNHELHPATLSSHARRTGSCMQPLPQTQVSPSTLASTGSNILRVGVVWPPQLTDRPIDRLRRYRSRVEEVWVGLEGVWGNVASQH